MKKLIFLELAILFLATTFSSNPPPGWYQQTLPVSDQINDIFFLDSLNGWVVTEGSGFTGDTAYIMNTTNSGNHWNIQYRGAIQLSAIQFLDSQTGYVIGNGLRGIIYKTTNGGANWNLIHDFNPAGLFRDISFVNKDTGWVCSEDPFDGGVFRTNDGGQSWQQQLNLGIGNPQKIFFLNKEIGWFGNSRGQLYKTQNGGTIWNGQVTFNSIEDILFVNKDTGWICDNSGNPNIKYTSNGGNNWIYQSVPPRDGVINYSNPERVSSIDGEVAASVGGNIFYGMGRFRGILFKSTNSGSNWFYQLPDTSIQIGYYSNIQLINNLVGWASYTGIIHSTDGGGLLLKIDNINSKNSNTFSLYQNYPNPFNPKTVISYKLQASSSVKLKVFNVQGKEVKKIVNQQQPSGEYKVEFDGTEFNSGVYFYVLEVFDERSAKAFLETKSMVLIK